MSDKTRKIWKLVLTGGPCGGKTTGQDRLSIFFENLGWKVYRVPEAANILLSGGVNFAELTPEAAEEFQENLLMTMFRLEETFFSLAQRSNRNCLVICDRGAMDASAFIAKESWERILARHGFDEVEIRDNRYNQVVHMMTAARGAVQFYTTEGHSSRSESITEAIKLDAKAAEAWVGHPYVDVVDNSMDFESKINQLIFKVAWSIGIDVSDRFGSGAKKYKFVVVGPLPSDEAFPRFCDFEVCHHYLQSSSRAVQNRLRKRGRKGKWSYMHTLRKEVSGQRIEVRTPLTHRQYSSFLAQEDPSHFLVFKTRRCFLFHQKYFQLDIYKEPCHPRCKGLMLLETYSTGSAEDLLQQLPDFLDIGMDVTGDPAFSMFNLSLKEDWVTNDKFCGKLCESHFLDQEQKQEAEERLAANISRQSSPSSSKNCTPAVMSPTNGTINEESDSTKV